MFYTVRYNNYISVWYDSVVDMAITWSLVMLEVEYMNNCPDNMLYLEIPQIDLILFNMLNE